MKRALAFVLAAIMGLSLVTFASAEDRITLTVFTGIEANTPNDINSMEVFQKAAAATGIDIEWVTVAQSSFGDKLGVILATDDLPDIIFGGVSTAQLATYGEQGSFIPMEDLITPELAPNLSAIFASRPDLVRFNTAPDGHMYGVPRVTEGPWNRTARIYSINQTWLDNLGLSMPTNLDEFKAMLIAFRDNDPNGNGIKDEIPLTFECGGNFKVAPFEYIFGAYGLAVFDTLLDVQDGKVVCVAQDPRFKEAIKFIAELYSEGLIDPDVFVQDNAQWKAKLNTEPGIVGVTPNWDHADNISIPDIYAQYTFMPPLKGNDGSDPVVYCPQMYGYTQGFGVITKECKNPEAAMKWIDYWYDMINSVECSEGCIGERQYVNDEGTIVTGSADKTVVGELKPRAACCINPYAPRALMAEYYSEKKIGIPSTYPKVDFITDHIIQYADPDPFIPKLYYTVDESDTISMLETDIRNMINTKASEWIMNGNIDEEWDKFQEDLQRAGLSQYLEVQQGAYDRLMTAD